MIWGDNHCEHQWGNTIPNPMSKSGKHGPASILTKTAGEQHAVRKESNQGSFCSLCGAWKGAYGLEPQPEMYIEHTIDILREIRRVLRKDGVVFWNCGDSYFASGGAHKKNHANPGLSKSAERGGVPHGGQSGKRGRGLSSLKDGGSSLGNPYGECGDCQLNHSLGNGSCPVQAPETSNELSSHSHKEQPTDHLDNSDSAYQGDHSGGETLGLCSSLNFQDGVAHGVQESTTPASFESSRENQTDPSCSYYQPFQHPASQPNYTTTPHLKAKDLCLIPFRVAIAAQEDGWWVRSVIIWSKPNPMPESCKDRPSESHEYILMLTKSARYYWDADAVREPISESYADDKRPHGVLRQRFYPNSKYVKAGMIEQDSSPFPTGERATGCNIRSVWEFPTQPFAACHFAVFPEKLPEICIKAAIPEAGCCSKCGAPWERITKHSVERGEEIVAKEIVPHRSANRGNRDEKDPLAVAKRSANWYGRQHSDTKIETLGWQPTCKCNADKVPSICLDPFAGAGTTLWVAKKLNCKAVGYEISKEYCQLAVDRIRQQVLL